MEPTNDELLKFRNLRDRATKAFMDVDTSIHKYLSEHDKAMETFRAFKIIDKSNKEMLDQILGRVWIRQRFLDKNKPAQED